jgi:hypothetical protein
MAAPYRAFVRFFAGAAGMAEWSRHPLVVARGGTPFSFGKVDDGRDGSAWFGHEWAFVT